MTTTAVVRPQRGAANRGLPAATWKQRVWWLSAAAVWLWLAVCLVSFDSADWPSSVVALHNNPPANINGRIGAAVAWNFYEMFGFGLWIPLLLSGYALAVVASGRAITHPWVRAVGAILTVIAFGGLHATWFPNLGPLAGSEAGLVPGWAAEQLLARFNGVSTSLVFLLALLVGLVVAADELVLALPGALAKAFETAKPLLDYDYAGAWLRLRSRLGARSTPALAGVGAIPVDDLEGIGEATPAPRRRAAAIVEEVEDTDAAEESDSVEDEVDEDTESDTSLPPSPASLRTPLSADELREKISKLPVRMSVGTTTVARDEDILRQDDFAGYQFPTLDLLDNPEGNFSEKVEQFVREQAGVLTETIRQYDLDGEVTGIESGPVVTLYSVELAPGTRVARLETISKDIARALQAPNIRIIPNMVGRTAVGIEVPNRHKEKVRLKELMSSGHAEGMTLPMFLGKDSAGDALVADLTKMPHMLIAGTTGSGTSVCMNSIIMSWLYTKRPDEMKMVLVDPKMVELSQFADVPHLMCPVVTDMGKAAAILEWAVGKMEERYEMFRSTGVQNIAGYNALGEEELFARLNPQTDVEKARIPKKLPYMVFVVDELADLIMTHKEVELSVVRIAQKARAVGIHLILATQRPQANVVTGLIKSNMPCRVSFKVASSMDSRIVLDQKGAELLLGQGDMLVLTPSSTDLRRSQGTLVTDMEIRKVTKFLKEVAAPNFERALVSIRAAGDDSDAPGVDGLEGAATAARDPLFDKAVEVVIEDGRGSVSLLQRRLAIGYGRASRLVDLMGMAGILSNHKGSVARDVLLSMDDWSRMKAMRDNDGGGNSPADSAASADIHQG